MDKFKLGKKWFWIGIVSSIIAPLVGLIYGIALLVEKSEKKLKKEAVIIIILAIVLGIVYALTSIFFASKGYHFSPSGKLQGIPIKVEGGPNVGDILPKK